MDKVNGERVNGELYYLIDSKFKFWIKPEDKEKYGIEPNHLLLDTSNKVACGVIFKSSRGPDFPVGEPLLCLLDRFVHLEFGTHVGIIDWISPGVPRFTITRTYKSFKRMIDKGDVDWRKATLPYTGRYFFVDKDLELIPDQRPNMPF